MDAPVGEQQQPSTGPQPEPRREELPMSVLPKQVQDGDDARSSIDSQPCSAKLVTTGPLTAKEDVETPFSEKTAEQDHTEPPQLDPPHTSTQLPLSVSPADREECTMQKSTCNDHDAIAAQDHAFQEVHHPTQICSMELVPPQKCLPETSAEHVQVESPGRLAEGHELGSSAECQSSTKCNDKEVGTEKNQVNTSKEGHQPGSLPADDSKPSTEQRISSVASKTEASKVPSDRQSRPGSELVGVNLATDATYVAQLIKMPMAGVQGKATEELMVGGLITSVPSLAQRAEIDTAAPFESVKAAVSLFGERVDWKSQQRAPQLQVSSLESEVNKVQEDLGCCKEQLALTRASTAGVLLELKKIKRLIEKSAGMRDVMDISLQEVTVAPDPSKMTRAVTSEHQTTDLGTIWKEIGNVKEKLVSAQGSKELVRKGLQEAHIGLNAVLKRVDELAGEQASLDEALAAAHLTLADAEEQVALLRSGEKVDLVESVPGDFMEKKNEEIKGLKLKLQQANALIVKQKEELVAMTKAESYAIAVAAEKSQELAMAKLQFEQAKAKELSMVGKVARILEESDELKRKLETAVEFIAIHAARVAWLDKEREQTRSMLDTMHEEEQAACATLASLQDDLQKVKEALVSAHAGEARAVQAKETLPGAIKEAAYEADEAKAAAEASKEEVRKARQGIEEAKAATSTAMSRHQAALKEVEAARASEAMALAELKALTESEAWGVDMEAESEGVIGVLVSLEEYTALKRAGVEAEGLADNKVAEAVSQVEEAKASQTRAQLKLDDALKETEEGKDELLKAQKQADDAQEAKLTAEGDLRKWRAGHDPRRKSVLDPKAGASRVSLPNHGITSEETVKAFAQDMNIPPVMQGKKVAGRDSLAQVMSLKLPAPKGHDTVSPAEDRKKQDKLKRSIMRRLVSLVVVKKKTSHL